MERRATFDVYGDIELQKRILGNVKGQIIEEKIMGERLEITVFSESPAYQYLQSVIEDKKLRGSCGEVWKFMKKEIEAAQFYRMGIADPWELDGKSEENFNTDYDMSNACSRCGAGRELASDLKVPLTKIKKKDIAMLPPSIIINERLYDLIHGLNLTGCSFKPVRDYRTNNSSSYRQLIINNILPPLQSPTQIIKEEGYWYCHECGKRGNLLRSGLAYRESDLSNAKDFNVTQEWFGLAVLEHEIIVSKRVREVFKQEKIKSVVFQPVYIV